MGRSVTNAGGIGSGTDESQGDTAPVAAGERERGSGAGCERGGAAERVLRYHRVPRFELESGTVLEDVVQAYHLDGELNAARDNLVVIFHALTGTPDAVGEWWRPIAGPGRVIDTDHYAVLCTNLIGSCYGTSHAPLPSGERPKVTTRDMARLIRLLVDELGVRSVAFAVGGSLGGMVALEWAASFPELTRSVVSIAAPAAHTAQAIGWNHVQRRVIEVAGEDGLAIARMVGMLTYRTADEFDARFGRELRPDGRFQAQSYLDHHGGKLLARFDVRSYLTLIDAMDAHDVGRGRGGVAAALRAFRGRLTGVGIPGDLLYRDVDVRSWTDAAGAAYREIHSIHGHDAFLLEPEQVERVLTEALGAASPLREAAAAGPAR